MSSQTNYGYDNAQLTGSEHTPRSTTTERSIVVDAESALWSSATQHDQARLEWLLHDDFSGVTRDGEQVGREELMGMLHRAVPRGGRHFSQWGLHGLPWPLVLTTYSLADDQESSLHLSVWDISTGVGAAAVPSRYVGVGWPSLAGVREGRKHRPWAPVARVTLTTGRCVAFRRCDTRHM